MKLYIEVTDGSSIESKMSVQIWQYRNANPGFGSIVQFSCILESIYTTLAVMACMEGSSETEARTNFTEVLWGPQLRL